MNLYSFMEAFAPLLSILIAGLFALVFPFLVFKSLRFRARYSAYRNIRFRFRGTLGESYRVFLGFPFLLLFTFGLLFPYVMSRQKEYVFGRFAFGTMKSKFYGGPGLFFKAYALALLMGAGVVFLLLRGSEMLTERLGALISPVLGDYGVIAINIALIYIVVVPLFLLIQEFIFVKVANYCWTETTLGKVSFSSTLQVLPMAWIRLTNILAIVVSFGLLIPWAKVRRTRYILDNLAVVMREGELDDVLAEESENEGALGEVASEISGDAFDFEIGL